MIGHDRDGGSKRKQAENKQRLLMPVKKIQDERVQAMEQQNNKRNKLKTDGIPSFIVNGCLRAKMDGVQNSSVIRVLVVGYLNEHDEFLYTELRVSARKRNLFRNVIVRACSGQPIVPSLKPFISTIEDACIFLKDNVTGFSSGSTKMRSR